MIKQQVTDDGLVADFYTDTSGGPRKAIIMLGGSEGGNPWSRIKIPVALLVKKGYAVLTLAYYKGPGLPNTLQEIPLEYFEKAFNWLSKQSGVVPNQFAVLGGSKGAEAALVLASKFPQIKAVIAFSPSCVVWQGLPKNRLELVKDVKSAWSFKGETLPFLAYPSSVTNLDFLLLRLKKMHEDALQDSTKARKAAIQVERIRGPILLISGRWDRVWPAATMGEIIISRLKENQFEFHHEHIAYKTGHNGIILKKDSWRHVFKFLEKHYA